MLRQNAVRSGAQGQEGGRDRHGPGQIRAEVHGAAGLLWQPCPATEALCPTHPGSICPSLTNVSVSPSSGLRSGTQAPTHLCLRGEAAPRLGKSPLPQPCSWPRLPGSPTRIIFNAPQVTGGLGRKRQTSWLEQNCQCQGHPKRNAQQLGPQGTPRRRPRLLSARV